MKRLLILATLLILTACAAATESPTPTASPSPTETATVTPSPTATPSITPSPTLPISTPVFPASQVAHSLLMSTGSSPTCDLPCWHDLRVGISTQADVERVFTELFGADDRFDFFAPPRNPDFFLKNLLNIEGVYAGGHNWFFEESESGPWGAYYLYAYMDENTGLLSGIWELIYPYSIYKAPALPEIIERLGEPGWLYGERSVAGYAITLMYEQGVLIDLFIPFSKFIDTDMALFCFDEQPQTGAYLLADPFVSLDREDWSPLKKSMQIPSEPAPYIDEGLGIASIEEFIEFVNSNYPCFETSREYESE